MQAIAPHYLLFTEVRRRPGQAPQWRFVLQRFGDGARMAAADSEVAADLSRLELLAVVRGLEALEQPSRVTLLAGGRYVRRGIRHDLAQWREHNWRWERFGRLVPVRDQDLWQRVDRTLSIHRIEFWPWQASADVPAPIVPEGVPAADSDHGPALVIVPRSGRTRLRRAATREVAGARTRTDWRKNVAAAMAAPGRTALCRTA